MKLLILEEPNVSGKSFKSKAKDVIVVFVICLKLLILEEPKVSGESFKSIAASSLVVSIVCFIFLRFEISIPFVNSLLSNFPSFDDYLKWVILKELKTSVKSFISIIPSVVVVE